MYKTAAGPAMVTAGPVKGIHGLLTVEQVDDLVAGDPEEGAPQSRADGTPASMSGEGCLRGRTRDALSISNPAGPVGSRHYIARAQTATAREQYSDGSATRGFASSVDFQDSEAGGGVTPAWLSPGARSREDEQLRRCDDRTRGVATNVLSDAKNLKTMRTTCAKPVPTQRISSGSNIHKPHASLWTANTRANLSPTISTPLPTHRTQIVHKPVGKITEVNRHFSATSTGPITTTTIYIHI